ncbi:MAG: a-glycosyltransferase [Bacteroidetes bacterium]|jgi:glycosyltransferase involved in cell wall biosynthesis|nr:a-glycosyltransferase [Bacteroidota bacterium]
MKIVVNTRLLLKNKLEGIGWFSYETLKRITANHPEHHFIFLFDREPDEEFIFSDNVTPLILSPQARHPILFYLWFEFSVAGILNKMKPDLFLSPDGYLSLSANCKQLAVIHDLNFEHYPNDVSFTVRKYYKYFFPRFARKASRIATVSEFSKNDIIKTYSIDPSKIDVVYNGCNTNYAPVSDEIKKLTRNKYSGDKEYFLFVGALHPRKNIARLFQAFDKFRKSSVSDVKLLIVGAKYYWTKEIRASYENMQFKNDVVFTGRLNSEELNKVLGSALALTYVPYFEGFGIPILEAFNCHTPVITSNVTSMPEVAGDAALLVDPFSVDSIADGLLQIYQQPELRKTLIEKGIIRNRNFSWAKTADALWESVLKAV